MKQTETCKEFYDHKFAKTASSRSCLFLCNTLDLDENKKDEMITIMEHIQDIYLKSLELYVSDREAFCQDIKTMKDPLANLEERKKADNRVWEYAKDYGLVIAKGDVLTCERISSAKKFRRWSETKYESLSYIQLAAVGMWHAAMNKMMVDYSSRMPDEEYGFTDILSLAHLKKAVSAKRITADPKKIANQVEYSHQFLETCGKEAIKEAWRSYRGSIDLVTPTNPEEAQEQARTVIKGFLVSKGITFYYDRLGCLH